MFQRMMNSIFQELLHEEILANYMDNFVILDKNDEGIRRKNNPILKLQRNTICVLKDQNVTLIWKKFL